MANTDKSAVSDYAKVEMVKKLTIEERMSSLIADLKDFIDGVESIKRDIGQYYNSKEW